MASGQGVSVAVARAHRYHLAVFRRQSQRSRDRRRFVDNNAA